MKTVLWLVVAGMVTIVSLVPSTAVAHERKEVAGLSVLFGAEPEPALTGRVQFLRWRFRAIDSEEPFSDLEDLAVVITRNGQDYGPFESRVSRLEPGLVQTQHIFTAAGEYDVVLSFRESGSEDTHSVASTYLIRDRQDLEIP